jgi:hypothetical protein
MPRSALLNTRSILQNPKGLKGSISKAIAFLRRSQLPYGEFKTYASNDEHLREHCRFDSSNFVTALVLYSISFCEKAQVRAMTANGLSFLHAEEEGSGLWRFWSSRNKAHEFLPPDLDDTCCISFIFKKFKQPLPQNRKLILANRNSAGIFYTWIAARPNSSATFVKELDRLGNRGAAVGLSLAGVLDKIDCAINANVLLYLGESAETKRTIDYLVDTVWREKDQTCSDFYSNRLSFYYMLSRAYFNGLRSLGEARNPAIDRVISLRSNDGSIGNELFSALAACTLINFNYQGPALDAAIKYLARTQKADGSWRRIPMFLGPAPYYGSEDLTTALCVEALARYYLTPHDGSTQGGP